jgi:PAS domain S-box-containing protein
MTGGVLQLNIGPRLALCFVLIILAMLLGDAIVLWQFQTVRGQAGRLNGYDQEFAAVVRVHASLLSFHGKLEALADDQNSTRMAEEAGPLQQEFVDNTQRAKTALSSLPSGIQPDTSILPTIEIVQRTLRSQLDEITEFAAEGDWSAVHRRIANQVRPLEFLTSTLVEKVDREIGEEQAQAAQNIRRSQQRVFVMVPVTSILTVLIAAALGLGITRSITGPLARLVEGSRRLARGEFDYKVPIQGNDELSHLGQVFNDTGRQLQELYASLQNSEDRLRRVINTIPAYVWSTLPDGSVDFVNQRLSDSTGLSAEDLSKAGWSSIVHPDDLARYVNEWHNALATGEPTESEARVRTAKSEYRWMLVRNVPLRDTRSKIIKWYGTGIDIEDRKRVEEQLLRSEAYLSEAQRLSRTGSFGWQAATGEILWSEETFHIFGYESSTKPSLRLVIERTHPEDAFGMQKLLGQVASDGSSFDVEHRLLMPNGDVKHVHVVAHALRDSSGAIEFIGAVTDITSTKNAEESLRKAQADLAHVNRVTTLGELTATLAHEVNQPIAAASINANVCLRLLKREEPDIEEASKAATRMVGDVNRAAEIISRVRQFFRKGSVPREPVDVNELMREMIVILRNEVAQSSITVQMDFTADLPPAIADRVQLQQVLMNLMINGIDAMKNVDGMRQLTLRSRLTDEKLLLVSVQDTGLGLPADQADQIFTAFFTTKNYGTGMGLSISRSIIESHGGRLWAGANEERGANFQFTLPSGAAEHA